MSLPYNLFIANKLYLYNIFTVPFQVRSITDEIIPLQSGSVFYERTKLTGEKYKHSYVYNTQSCIWFDGRITAITMVGELELPDVFL